MQLELDNNIFTWPFFSLACRCANKTRENGWKVFGLQFYGECWSGENGETAFNKYGEADPKKCIQELVEPFPPCDKSKDMECVGTQSTNYIYRLKDCEWILSSKENILVVNIWKSYIWTAVKDVNIKAIFAVINTT